MRSDSFSISQEKQTIYSNKFILLCVSSLFFSASFNMIIPELPAYLTGMGGEHYIGLIISLFTLTAGLSRPFSGKLTDTIGRRPVIIIGAIVCIVCGFMYPLLSSVAGFLFLRLFHGFSTGFSPTGLSTYVADITPQKKWGEALGIQGLCWSTGMALGPAIGSYIKMQYSYDVLFYSSSLFAIISILPMMGIGETLNSPQSFKFSLLKIARKDIFEPRVIIPAIVTFLGYLAFGMMLTLIPDWSVHVGISNKGMFFIVFTIASLFIRFTAGKLSDKYGRMPITLIGLILLAVGMFTMGSVQNMTGLMAGAIVYGLSMGILTPTLNAWTVDWSLNDHRGKAIATMYIAIEAGIGLGALISGSYYASNTDNIPPMMLSCGVMGIIGVLFIILTKHRHPKT